MTIQTIRDELEHWLLLGSILLVTTLYFLYQRQGRTLAQVKSEAERNVVGQKLTELRAKAQESQEGFDSAMQSYRNLKSRFPQYFTGPDSPGG